MQPGGWLCAWTGPKPASGVGRHTTLPQHVVALHKDPRMALYPPCRMAYAAGRMNDDRSPSERRATVPEAAEILGISPEAVRARLSRGTLPKEKGPDGTTYVRLNDDRTHSNDDGTDDRTEADALVFRIMQDQIEHLRREVEDWKEEARRKDAILMTMAQRIPAIEEASSEPRESDVSASAEQGGDGVPPEQEKPVSSWWRRLFG